MSDSEDSILRLERRYDLLVKLLDRIDSMFPQDWYYGASQSQRAGYLALESSLKNELIDIMGKLHGGIGEWFRSLEIGGKPTTTAET